jgi:hypothetical protein
MKSPHAITTPDLLGDTCDLAGERPAKPKGKTTKQRLAEFMTRHKVRALTVFIDADVLLEFEHRAAKNGHKKKEVIERLIKSQYLRKR